MSFSLCNILYFPHPSTPLHPNIILEIFANRNCKVNSFQRESVAWLELLRDSSRSLRTNGLGNITISVIPNCKNLRYALQSLPKISYNKLIDCFFRLNRTFVTCCPTSVPSVTIKADPLVSLKYILLLQLQSLLLYHT
jgi:hypothetical protein